MNFIQITNIPKQIVIGPLEESGSVMNTTVGTNQLKGKSVTSITFAGTEFGYDE